MECGGTLCYLYLDIRTNHMCVTVSAEQELLDFSEDTVFNQLSFTSFEQDSVNTYCGMSEIITEDAHVLGDSSNSMEGNLFKCYEFWKNTLIAPESVLNIISNGYVLPFRDQPPRKVIQISQ